MATGLLMTSSLLSLSSASGYELDIVESFQPTASSIIGYIAIGEEMHFELDVTIGTMPSDWASIFHCGSSNSMRMPGIWLHPDSGTDGGSREGFYTCWRHDDDNHCVQTDHLTVGQTYHLEIDITPTLYTVTQDGVVQYSGAKGDHTTYDSMVCYASNPWHDAAVATISNLRVWAGEQPPTASPTKSVYELLDITNDKLGVVDLIYDQLMEMRKWLMKTFGGLQNQQCYVYETEYDGDRLDNPIFEGGGFIGTYTLDECWAHCETSTDSKGRPCVAIEWSDGGDAQSSSTTKSCALAWGCDYTEYWSGGSVYQMTTTVSVNAAAAVSDGEVIAEEANETNSTGNGSLDWVTTVIGAMIGVVAIGAVVVFLMLMTKKRKRAAEEEKTEMSNAVPQHVVPEMSISSVAVPATTSGATVEE